MLMMCLLPAVVLAGDYISIPHSSDLLEGGWIELEGDNMVQVPNLSLISHLSNLTYPISLYPVYSQGQAISGIFRGPESLKGAEVEVSITRFNASSFLSALGILERPVGINERGISLRLNDTGDKDFILPGVPGGFYTVFVRDNGNSTILSAAPLIVTEGEISLDLPERVTAGGALKVGIKSHSGGEKNRTYGAIMISRKDYNLSSLSIETNSSTNYSANSSTENLSFSMAIGDRSMKASGMPSISTDFLMKILMLLPGNSAASIEESTKPEVELYLLTDSAWEKGNYTLTCAAYSGKVLDGLKQVTIEVV